MHMMRLFLQKFCFIKGYPSYQLIFDWLKTPSSQNRFENPFKLLGQGVLMARHNGPWTTDYFNMDGQSGNMLNQIDRSLFDFMDDLTNLQNGDLYEINEVIQHAEGQSCKNNFDFVKIVNHNIVKISVFKNSSDFEKSFFLLDFFPKNCHFCESIEGTTLGCIIWSLADTY